MKTKTYSKGDMITVKCSSCGSDMDCPKEMLAAGNHLCHVCTEVLTRGLPKEDAKEIAERERYIDKNKDDMMKLGMLIHDTSFRAIKMTKRNLRETSKKELAETMHFDGVMSTISFFMHAGMPAEALKELTRAAEESRKYTAGKDGQLQSFVDDTQKVLDCIGAIGEKLEKMGVEGKEFDRVMKSADAKAFDELDADTQTEDGLIKIMNKLLFKGDWQEHLKWTEKHGTPKDVEAVKRGMGEELI